MKTAPFSTTSLLLILITGLYLLLSPLPGIASDSDSEPVLIYIDPETGKYRTSNPAHQADAAKSTGISDNEGTGVTTTIDPLIVIILAGTGVILLGLLTRLIVRRR